MRRMPLFQSLLQSVLIYRQRNRRGTYTGICTSNRAKDNGSRVGKRMEKRRQVSSIKKLPRVGARTNHQSQINAGNGVKREVLGWLIAARSGHGHFADYHERFGHEEEHIHCNCGQRRSKSHPFSCSSARAFRFKLFSITDRRLLTQKEVMGTAQGIKMFAEWAPWTELFGRSKRMRDVEEV